MTKKVCKKTSRGFTGSSTGLLIKSTLILSVFSIFGKVLGAVFKLPLTAIVGAEGIGLYQLAFPVFVLLFTIASSGVSTALTIKIAECDNKDHVRIGLKYCTISSLVLGSIVCLMSNLIAGFQGNNEIRVVYYFVALAVVGVSILNGLKAILRGKGEVVSFAVSETIEQVSKVALALCFAYLLVDYGLVYAISGVFVAIFLSTVIASVFCVICIIKMPAVNLFNKAEMFNNINNKCSVSEFVKLSGLSTLGLMVVPVFQFFESAIIINLLKDAGFSATVATSLLGVAQGMVATLINLPLVAIMSLEFVLLPMMVKSKDIATASSKTKHSIFLAFVICSPFVFLYLFFPSQILELLYGASLSLEELHVAVGLMQIGSIQLLFAGLLQVLIVCLQGIKRMVYPPIILTIGGVVKLVVLFILVPKLGILGSEFACVMFSIVATLLALLILKKQKINVSNIFAFVPFVASLVIVLFVKFMFNVLNSVMGLFASVAISGVVGAGLYLVAMLPLFKFYAKRNFISE